MISYKNFSFIKNSSYIKNTLILTAGTIIAQIIPLAFYPILTRLYTPSDFGVFATVSSITAILSVVATGKYESVVLIADTKRAAANVIWLTLIIAFFTLFLFELIFLNSGHIAEIFNIPSLNYWILISPPTAFLIIIFYTNNEWYVKNKYFVNLSYIKITNSASNTALKTVIGWTKILNGGLIIGEFIGRLITAFVCVFYTLKNDSVDFYFPSLKQLKVLAKRYIQAPKFVLPAQTLNTLGGQLPVLLMATSFNTTELGYFAMAMSILALPASLVSIAVRDTFRKQALDIYKQKGNSYRVYKRTLTVMAFVSLLGFSLFYLIAPQLFSWVLGQDWIIAGEYSRILVPIVAISFIAEIGTPMFIIAEKMKRLLLWQIMYFLLSLVSVLVGIYFFEDFKNTLFCFMVGRSTAHIISLYMTNRIANGK